MNRREMLCTGWRQLVQTLPDLLGQRLGHRWTGPAPPSSPPPALSFPRQSPEPAPQPLAQQKPLPEEE